MKTSCAVSPDEREKSAVEFFKQGYNCCQSVLMTFSDVTGMPTGEAAGIAAGFGGGMGRMREVCGAFSACVMMAGYISPAATPEMGPRKANYELVQELAAEFRSRNGGSIICRELLGPDSGGSVAPSPSERSSEYYRKRPCAEIVGTAARIVAEKIISKQSK